jgi:hypothetical protein
MENEGEILRVWIGSGGGVGSLGCCEPPREEDDKSGWIIYISTRSVRF